jgi:hypothetical protein
MKRFADDLCSEEEEEEETLPKQILNKPNNQPIIKSAGGNDRPIESYTLRLQRIIGSVYLHIDIPFDKNQAVYCEVLKVPNSKRQKMVLFPLPLECTRLICPSVTQLTKHP